jgi:hypothetical protein
MNNERRRAGIVISDEAAAYEGGENEATQSAGFGLSRHGALSTRLG